MIKRILVPLDPSPYAETALKIACFIAKRHEAELAGLVVLDVPGIEKSIGPIPAGGLHYAERLEQVKAKEAQEHIARVLAKFRAKCDQEEDCSISSWATLQVFDRTGKKATADWVIRS